MQTLYETYEQCADAPQFSKDAPLPVGHTTQQAHIEIVLDGHGRFRRASVVSKMDRTTLVPCTEESAGRSGVKPVHHPLCDKLQYVAKDFVEFGGEVTKGFSEDPHQPFNAFVNDLAAWSSSPHGHSKLNAILTYVREGRVTRDLVGAGILPIDQQGALLKKWEGDEKTAPPIFKVIPNTQNPEHSFIRWRVEAPSDPGSGTWEDRKLVDSWIAYYASQQSKPGICMVTGKDTVLAEQHPAKLRHAGDKAKLISSNDSTGYTFRGRFVKADEACGVGFDVTQKAHSALRWLIQRQGYRNGDQVIVTWAVAGKPAPDPFQDSLSLFLDAEKLLRANATPAREHQGPIGDAGEAFARRLNRAIAGYRAKLDPADAVVVMALDSATTGRMAITFYRELASSEFLGRVSAWHERYAWLQEFGMDPESRKVIRFIGAPSPKDVAEAAYGPARDQKRSLNRATVQRLLPCIIDGRPLPRDIIEAAVRRTCSRPSFEKQRDGTQPDWEKNLGIACALFKGHFTEREYKMTLENDRTSRDYLFGRLLAIAEHLEGRALYVAGESRDTNAARLMQRFADRPGDTWRIIELALTPYKTRLHAKRPAFLYKMEQRLDEVISAFSPEDFLDERKLSGEFLLGYHCERAFLKRGEASAPEIQEEIDEKANTYGDVS